MAIVEADGVTTSELRQARSRLVAARGNSDPGQALQLVLLPGRVCGRPGIRFTFLRCSAVADDLGMPVPGSFRRLPAS
jgi:hypothetical protein